MSYGATQEHHHDDHDHKPAGLGRWLFSTNHKDIGTMYLVFALIMLFVGGAMAMVVRAELFQPGLQYVDPQFFNAMTTMHALVMIFGVIMPAGVGLANWMVPMMIGAPDMALPRMNNMSFWILPFAFTMLLSTFFMEGGAPAGGWTMYPPLITQLGDGFPFLIFTVHFLGVSSIMGAINIIATVFNMRAPGIGFMQLPLFVWTWIITAFLLIAAMPVLAGAVTMLLTDKYFGTSFFAAAGGGDPVMFQHIFLVLRPSGGIYPDPAGVRHRLADYSDIFPQAPVRLRVHGVCHRGHCLPVVFLSGRTTCLRWACPWPASCSSCMRPCPSPCLPGSRSSTGLPPCGAAP